MNKKDAKKHLTVWEDFLSIHDFYKFCEASPGDFKFQTANIIKEKQYKTVLDAGAGICDLYYVFKEICYEVDYTAIDLTKKYVDECIAKGIKISKQNIEQTNFIDHQFDCVTAFDVINHQLDYRASIKELLRIAKKEVFISFFKKFEEESSLYADYHGEYETYQNEFGLIENRVVDPDDGEAICIYNFINKKKLINFLETLENIEYEFYISSCKRGMLRIRHK